MNIGNYHSSIEKSRLSGRLALISILLTLALAIIVFLAGPALKWAGMETFTLSLFPAITALIYAITALIQAILYRRMVEEEDEKRILERRKSNVNSILDVAEDVRFTAAHTLDNFNKYIPSAVSALIFLCAVPALWYFWKNSTIGAEDTLQLVLTPKNPINLAFLTAMMAIFSFFMGIFLVGQSHVREYRFLRPVGSWLIFFAIISITSAISALFINFGKSGWTTQLTKLIYACCAVLTAELLVSFIIEFYRPRNAKEQRPVYESRLLALFTEPGGFVRNMADSLDYQFGFEVSRTGIYLFFRKAIIPAVMIWIFFLWIFTCVAEVKPGEKGIRERFGAIDRTQTPLEAGIHIKMPWPCERIMRVPTDIVQVVTIGTSSKSKEGYRVILWTGDHYQTEDNFLVAVDRAENSGPFPVSILEVSLPVFFTASPEHVYDYAYNFDDVNKTLKAIGQAEATNYFASTDFSKDISSGREAVAKNLHQRIQQTCDELELGIRIVSVNMHDAHPPVKSNPQDNTNISVAEAFQSVVCAQEEAVTTISKAREYETQTLENAKVERMQILGKAEAYRYDTEHVAFFDAARFESQLASYHKMPGMFELRTYLDFLENDCKDIRKFIISDQIDVKNYVLNLEEKASLDLLDTDLNALAKPAD